MMYRRQKGGGIFPPPFCLFFRESFKAYTPSMNMEPVLHLVWLLIMLVAWIAGSNKCNAHVPAPRNTCMCISAFTISMVLYHGTLMSISLLQHDLHVENIISMQDHEHVSSTSPLQRHAAQRKQLICNTT